MPVHRPTKPAGRPVEPGSARHGAKRVTVFVTPAERQLLDRVRHATGLELGEILMRGVAAITADRS